MPDFQSAERRELVWRRLSWLAILLLTGWLASMAFHHFQGTVLARPYPYNTYFFHPEDRYNDLLNSWRQAQSDDPYFEGGTAAVATYFPLVYYLLSVARKLAPRAVLLMYFALTFGGALWLCFSWLREQRPLWKGDARWPVVILFATLLAVVNYPLLFAVDRGNLDPLVMILLAGAGALALRGHFGSGGLLVALAAASKGYPAVWFLYWAKQRRLLALAAGLLATAALVILPGLAFKGGITTTLRGLQHGLRLFHDRYVVGSASAHFSSDGLNAVRLTAAWAGITLDMAAVVRIYQYFALLWAAALAFPTFFFTREPWRELLALALIAIVFPNIANDYKLVLLLPAIFAWMSAASAGWRDRLVCVCAGLLLVPKHYGFIPLGDQPSISCLVSPLLLAGLSAVLWPTRDELARLQGTVVGAFQRHRAFLESKRLGRSAMDGRP